MKKLLLILFGLLLAVAISAQSTRVYNQNIQINKTTPVLDLQGLGAKIYLDGATSGTATLQPPAVAGATVHTLPSVTGTLTNFEDTTLTLATQWKARDAVHDTVQMERDNAVLGLALVDTVGGSSDNDYVPGAEYMESYVETYAGGELTGKILRFIVDVTTGAPTNADSTIVHSEFGSSHIDLFRNGDLQYFHTESANTIDSTYRVDGDTIFVKPLWSNNERVEIRVSNAIAWSDITLEGEESTLLTRLMAYYKVNESTKGLAFVDETGTRNGNTVYNDSIKTGILGYGRKFNYKGSTSVTNNDSINPHGSAFSVSCWIKLDTLSSVRGAISYVWAVQNTATPYTYHYLNIGSSDNKLTFMSYSTTPTLYTVKSAGALVVGTWYHIVAVNSGNGSALKLYLNGADVSASASGSFTGDVREANSYFRIANVGYNYVNNLPGIIDEIGIWSVALTPAQVTELYNSGVGKTYPFL